MTWRTRIERPWLAPLGIAELHAAIFQSVDDSGGARPCVMIQIPESGRHDGKRALAMAAKLRARFLIVADTAEQAADMARLAARRLRRHRRIAYERAAAGAFGPLSS